MKEKPILFSESMVRAILAGKKTQTRRIVKSQRVATMDRTDVEIHDLNYTNKEHCIVEWTPYRRDHCVHDFVPPWAPTDRLWVRETHAYVDHLFDGEREDPTQVAYRADKLILQHTREPLAGGSGNIRDLFPTGSVQDVMDPCGLNWDMVKWRPSIYMPRWACRLVLEIVDVRMEWLQNISEGDAQREGWDLSNMDLYQTYDPVTMTLAREWFAELWDTINAKRAPWASNPLVWVIEFRRVEA